jgi:16S rRNA (cytidine1402-2'-O)-methyltransferase
MGILYLVATPLGNLEDITLRALRILREVSLIATEDTRTTGKLLHHYNIQCPMLSYHDFSPAKQQTRLLEALAEGDVALVSEAGTPLLSDPGYELVRAAIEHDIQVVAIPGASALLVALTISGLPMNQFCFGGFMPRKSKARQELLQQWQTQPATLVFYESPHRLVDTLKDMQTVLGGARQIALGRELTKLYEEIWRGTIAEAVEVWANRELRGEFTLVVAGAAPSAKWTQAQVQAALAAAMQTGLSPKMAVMQVTAQSGWPKREVYALVRNEK